MNEKFPILVIDDILDELHVANLFTKLDIYLGYQQVCMKEVGIPNIFLFPHGGHYEFLVMPFGLYNYL